MILHVQDVAVYSKIEAERERNIEEVLQVMYRAGVTLLIPICLFCSMTVEFFWHKIKTATLVATAISPEPGDDPCVLVRRSRCSILATATSPTPFSEHYEWYLIAHETVAASSALWPPRRPHPLLRRPVDMYPLSPSVMSWQHQGYPRHNVGAVGYAGDGESAIATKTAIMAEIAGGGRRSGRLQGFYGRRNPHEQ